MTTISQLIYGTLYAGMLLLGSFSTEAQNLFLGNYNSILEFSSSGGRTFNQTNFTGGLNYVRALAFDSAGDLFEVDCFSGQIFEFMNKGGTLNSSPIRFAYNLNHPGAMAFNKTGDLFVASDTGNLIYELTQDNRTPTVFANMGLDAPCGLAFDSQGNLYVSNFGNGTITKITPQNVQSTFASGLSNPDGLAFDAAGNLFVSDSSPYDSITEITQNDVRSTYVTGLNNPQELAFDSQGNLFVADDGTVVNVGDLTKIARDKTTTVISTAVGNPLGLAIQAKPYRKHHHWLWW